MGLKLKLLTKIKIKLISSSLNIIEFQLTNNGKYWNFLEIFAGKSGDYSSNKDLESFDIHRISCKNRNSSVANKIRKASYYKLPELAKIMSDSNLESINLKEMRILFIFDNSRKNATSEVLKNLYDSANLSKINAYVLDISQNIAGQTEIEIITEIIKFSPTIIIFALHGNLKRDPDYILSKELISEVRARTGCSVALICFDIWRTSDLLYVNYWKDVATFFLHVDPIALKKLSDTDLKGKFLLWPFPAAYGNQKALVSKKNRIIFSGSIKEKDRRLWIRSISSIIKKYNLKFQINIFNYHNPKFRLSWSEYMDELSQSLVCLSLGQKSNSHTILPGRTFDAISVGTLVLQQETGDYHPLSFLYNENLHYFKFNCLCEIDNLLDWISSNTYSVEQIGKNTSEFHFKHYSPEKLWKYLHFKTEELTFL